MDFSGIVEIEKDWKAMEMLEDLLITKRLDYVRQLEVYHARVKSAFDKLKKRCERASASETGDPGNAGSVKVDDTVPTSRGNNPDHKESSDSNANTIQSTPEVDSLCKMFVESRKHSGKDVSSSHSDGPQIATEDVTIVRFQAMQYLVTLQERLLRMLAKDCDETSEENRNFLETFKEAKYLREKYETHEDLPPAESASWVMDLRQKQINMLGKLLELHLQHLARENQLVKIKQEDWFFMGDLTKELQSLAETCALKVEPTAEHHIADPTTESTPEPTAEPTTYPIADPTADSTVDP